MPAAGLRIITALTKPTPLQPGSRIGPYEVRELLGAGGMGEVHRGHDVRLDRDVALKTLPAAFVADADRVARFEREARILATLNHPNIARFTASRARAAFWHW